MIYRRLFPVTVVVDQRGWGCVSKVPRCRPIVVGTRGGVPPSLSSTCRQLVGAAAAKGTHCRNTRHCRARPSSLVAHVGWGRIGEMPSPPSSSLRARAARGWQVHPHRRRRRRCAGWLEQRPRSASGRRHRRRRVRLGTVGAAIVEEG